MKLVLHIPYGVIDSNASQVSDDGKTLTWDLMAMASNQNVYAEFRLLPNPMPLIIIIVVLAVVLCMLITLKKNKNQINIGSLAEIVGFNKKRSVNKSDMIFCPHCGKKILSNSVFCQQCGEKIRF